MIFNKLHAVFYDLFHQYEKYHLKSVRAVHYIYIRNYKSSI
jgi:hypothetical protein